MIQEFWNKKYKTINSINIDLTVESTSKLRGCIFDVDSI